MRQKSDYEELYKQIFLGIAVGDALGMPVEGWKPQQIVKYVLGGRVSRLLDPQLPVDPDGERILKDEFGLVKQWNAPLKKGMWTDDTICSLDLADSLNHAGMNLEDLAQRRLISFDERNKMCGEYSGFGQTTRLAMENIRKGIHPSQSGVIGGPGTGPCMMMAPLGVFQHAREENGASAVESNVDCTVYAMEVARMTHLDTRSVVSGILQQKLIYYALSELDVRLTAKSIFRLCEHYESLLSKMDDNVGNLTSRIAWVCENYKKPIGESYKRFGAGSVVTQAYPFSLHAMLHYYNKPSMNALLDVISYGGDCDTTGSMVGAFFGARGLNYDRFIAELDQSKRIIDTAKQFVATKK
ncbi:MAG TPA: ADP-ribosylglycohydrolase family protein [Acidobacteriota bacterium]|nr:ADP-ribosylglycohydrolase family protein [Acidobacteriota bacterium]